MFENVREFKSEDNARKLKYKIYSDGSHFLGTPVVQQSKKKDFSRTVKEKSELDLVFENLFLEATKQGLCKGNYSKSKRLKNFLKNGLKLHFKGVVFEVIDIDNYVEEGINRILTNCFKRKKTFERKTFINPWNYMITVTYDSKKWNSEDDFKKSLKKFFSNQNTRRGWKVMGAFELSPDGKDRLHFHGFAYIPDGAMIGEIIQKKDYSTKLKRMQTIHQNTHLAEKFGRNDFEAISKDDINYGNLIDYILKYILKSGEKVFYSRGIPSEIFAAVKDEKIAVELYDFCLKLLFFDDIVIEVENYFEQRDIFKRLNS